MNTKEKAPAAGRKYNKAGSIVWAMKGLWRMDRKFVCFVFASVPVAVVLPLVQAYFPKVLLDGIGAGEGFAQLAGVCLGLGMGIALLSILQNYLQEKPWGWLYYFTTLIQDMYLGQLEYETDYENLEKQDYREISGYARQDACQGRCSLEFIWQDVTQALIHTLGVVAYASLLAVLHPLLFVVVAAVSVFSYFTTRWQATYYEKHKHQWEKENRKIEYLQNLSEDFPLAKDIKLYGLEGWLGKMMRDYQAYVLLWEKKCSLRGVWAAMLSGLMTLVQDGAAYVFLIALLAGGSIGVGDFVFYFGVVGSIAAFLTGIMGDMAALAARADKIGYYRSWEAYPNHFNHGAGCPLPAGAVKVEFKDVWYKYAGAEGYTLKGLNLVMEPGESIALVGLNGAGKTTLVKLLCGLYAPTKGEILVDGKRIDEYNIGEYYTLISAVFQEVTALAFPIWEFVASADPERPTVREDAEAALRKAGLWDKVERLPNGMDTHLMKGIYDDGVDFSGGEMQRLLLARAIYKNGPLLVLDEPTAALDPIAENKLYLQYRELTRGKTSLYISHRFASTRFCDRIVLLENGVIAESGTHEELMALGGQYAYLFGVQSKYYKEGTVNV